MEPDISAVKIIMGLGNPGTRYVGTYHNAGKLFVDYLKDEYLRGDETGGGFRKKLFGNFESCRIGNIALVKSSNFMNENGKAARAALKSFGAKGDSLLVAHDDSDIEIGRYKLDFGSGSAGHNGVISVIGNIGTKNFWRLRIGVGQPGQINRVKAGEFVLKKISEKDLELMRSAFKAGAAEIFGARKSG